MRSSTILAVIGAVVAAAQTLTDLPECGQRCISNMLAIAPSFGCAQGNTTCYCTQPSFGYGIRDCSLQSCPSEADARTVITFGTEYCRKALAGSGDAPPSAAPASSSGANTATGGSNSATDKTVIGDGGFTSVAVATSTLSGKTTVDGEATTEATATTTIFGIVSGLESTVTTDGSKITETTGMTTLTGAKASKATSGGGSNTTKGSGSGSGGGNGGGNDNGNGGSGNSESTTSQGLAPMATAMPGLIGAAVLAVLAL